MNVIKGTSALTKGTVWIWLEHIVSMNINQGGGAVIHTNDGQTIALTDKPEDVIKTVKSMMEVS
jgi:hypothetical protein